MLRGVEFNIGASELCRLLSNPSTGVRAFESKTWPQVDGFDPTATICHLTKSDAYGIAWN